MRVVFGRRVWKYRAQMARGVLVGPDPGGAVTDRTGKRGDSQGIAGRGRSSYRGMKRRELLEHLQQRGCELLREGGSHSIWTNPQTGRREAIPRHPELNDTWPGQYAKIFLLSRRRVPELGHNIIRLAE
jgi:mRNA interferase HicA